MRTINAAGLKILKDSEGCKLKAYPDPGTGGEPFTIGWGATGPNIKEGLVWTQEQADKRLEEDLRCRSLALENFTKGVSLNINRFSALVCFIYNVGAWRSSTLFRHILKGEYRGASENFPLWVHAGGKVLPGLVVRRTAERKLFDTPVPEDMTY